MERPLDTVELHPPDISAYAAGNLGPYAHLFDSGQPGPVVMINALTHGNEICGALALDFLFRHNIRPVRGSLILSFANVRAFQTFDPECPYDSRYLDEDLNRVWDTLEDGTQTVEKIRARELRPVVERADYLLDIHSMSDPDPLLILGTLDATSALERALAIALKMGYPRYMFGDRGHRAGLRMRDFGGFGAADGEKAALLVECGVHWWRETEPAALETCLRFLDCFGMLTAEVRAKHLTQSERLDPFVADSTHTITIETDEFAFARDYRSWDVIERQGTVFAKDGDRELKTPYDDCFLIMPARYPKKNSTAVRLACRRALTTVDSGGKE